MFLDPSIEFDSVNALLSFEELSSHSLCLDFPPACLAPPLTLLIHRHLLDLSMFMCTGLRPITLIFLKIFLLLYHDLDTIYMLMILQCLAPSQTFPELQTILSNISIWMVIGTSKSPCAKLNWCSPILPWPATFAAQLVAMLFF